MFRYCALIMVVLISLSYGCSHPSITQENTVLELNAVVRNPDIQFNHPRFYHQNQKSLVSIRYRNAGSSRAYHVVTDVKVFLDGHSVPIEEDSIGFVSILAPNAAREVGGILPDAFFEKVMTGTTKLSMEFTVAYQNAQGEQFSAVSIWQFSKTTMEPFFIEDRIKVTARPLPTPS